MQEIVTLASKTTVDCFPGGSVEEKKKKKNLPVNAGDMRHSFDP